MYLCKYTSSTLCKTDSIKQSFLYTFLYKMMHNTAEEKVEFRDVQVDQFGGHLEERWY